MGLTGFGRRGLGGQEQLAIQRLLVGRPAASAVFECPEQASALGDLGVDVVRVVQGEGFGRLRQARRAVLVQPVVAQDKVLEMEDKLLVEPGLGEMAVKLSKAQVDVPDQPPGVGVVVGEAAGEFPYLAEIVANGPGEQPGNGRRNAGTASPPKVYAQGAPRPKRDERSWRRGR